MKYQLNIVKNLFLSKYYKLILFYLVFYLLMYVILKVQYPVFNVSNFITMIGFIDIYNTSFLEIIYFVLEVTMIIYSLYLYFSYEEDTIKIKAKYKKENLKLKKEKKLDLDSEIKSYDITEDEKIKIFNKIQELCSKSSNSRLHITRIKFTRK